MARITAVLLVAFWSAQALASRYGETIGIDGDDEYAGDFSDATKLAIYVFIGLAAFVFFTWDEKRAWLRWGSRACFGLALVLLFTKPDLLVVFVFGPIALFFAWPLVSWIAEKVRR